MSHIIGKSILENEKKSESSNKVNWYRGVWTMIALGLVPTVNDYSFKYTYIPE